MEVHISSPAIDMYLAQTNKTTRSSIISGINVGVTELER